MIQKTYLILDTGANLIKIGKSCNPKSRMKDMQSHNGSILELMHVFPADIEKYLHVRYKAKRKHGEWFSVSASDVVEYVSANKELIEIMNDQLVKSGFEKMERNRFEKEALKDMGDLSWIDSIRIGTKMPIKKVDAIRVEKNMRKWTLLLGKKFKIKDGFIHRIP